MKIFHQISLLLLAIGILPAFAASPAVAAQPNIVFILADDMGYGDIATYGVPDARTPNLDRLAAEGVRFTQFYGGGPECTPSRTAFLTGGHAERIDGMECAIGTGNVGRYDDAIRLANERNLGLPASKSVIGHALRSAGYTNGVFGKWHLGYEPKFSALEHGFDTFFGFLGGYVDYYRHRELSDLDVLLRDREPVTKEGYLTHLINEEAVSFIRKNHERPFFLYVPHASPHFPFQSPHKDPGKMITADKLMVGDRETYVEMLEDLDNAVGDILRTLDETGVADRTIVVFTSDHGAMPPGRNLPWSNWKTTLFEGGLRVPCIVRWPGRIAPGTVSNQPAWIMDLTASFVRAGGATPPAGRPLDGIDILQHVEEDRPDFERTFYWRFRRGDVAWWAVRDGKMKYIRKRDGSQTEEWLFDLMADPGELHSLLPQSPQETRRLRGLLSRWESQMNPMPQ